MKKIIFIATLFAVLLHGGLFDGNSVKFKEADTNLKREYPTAQDHVLSYNSVLERVRTTVVNISTEKSMQVSSNTANPLLNDPFFREFFRGFGGPGFNIPQERVQRALGSGVIISENGYIVTNNHVVEGAEKIKVTIPGIKKEYSAEIIGLDPKSDLAVIKIDAEGLNPISFYDSDNVKIGDIVFALGNPFGVGETVTQGIVSATGRSSVGIVEYEDFIQTDASINPGNSGGALVNSAGYLIGINSAILSRSGGNIGIGFAIPSNMVKQIGKALVEKGKFTRAYLGVAISDLSEELSSFYGRKRGALVTMVEEDTPAKKYGIERGDLIISVDGKEVDSANDLRNKIGSITPGKKVLIELIKDKKLKSIYIVLSDRNSSVNKKSGGYEYEGLTVEPLTETLKKEMGIGRSVKGVIVSEVKQGSKAEEAGFRSGDIIVQIERNEIFSIDDFKKNVEGFSKKRFYIYRRGMVLVTTL